MSSDSPVFPRIAVVGLGLIGGSIALGLRRKWPAMTVVGVDRPDVLSAASRLGAITVPQDRLEDLGDVELIVLAGGNMDVMLCERGIRTFESYTRNTFDISAIPVVQKLSHLPIIADPSHGTGRRDKVVPMARAAVTAGADGLIIEVHCDPDPALSDGAQSMFPNQFDHLMAELRIIAPAIGRSICLEPVARRGWGMK